MFTNFKQKFKKDQPKIVLNVASQGDHSQPTELLDSRNHPSGRLKKNIWT